MCSNIPQLENCGLRRESMRIIALDQHESKLTDSLELNWRKIQSCACYWIWCYFPCLNTSLLIYTK